MQRRGPTGNTTASRVKALLLHVQARHGRAEADAFLLQTRLDRDYLDDETRPLPIELWHGALVAFASRFGRDAILDTVEGFVHSENLGVWTRVLRGSGDPMTAYRQLDNHGGEDALTDRWHTLRAEPGEWRGRIALRDDPAHERDGLCQLARRAELAAVPLLFGLPPAAVETSQGEPDRSGGAVQEYVARWRGRGWLTAPAIGGAVGLAASGAIDGGLHASVLPGLAAAAIAGVLGAATGGAIALERRRRAQSRAQLMRIHVLERSAALRETRERGAAGFRVGVVIAGQYRLGDKLGVGASGTIWEAVRLADGEVVAIKLLRTAVAHDTIAADRLRREAAALGLSWHQNVVEVYDDGHLPDGTSYLVMERLYGESLATRLHRAGALSPAELLPIALQVCDALGAVHAAGVVHRDLKPSNIYLARPAHGDPVQEPVVKLLDFGIARVEWAETRLTNMGASVGTPGYMAPEQEQGLEIDGRADLFALGGVLYECLSGQPPPVRSDELWQPAPVVGESTSGVQRALQAIPDAWRNVIERALSRAPRQRYPGARSFRKALAKLEPPDIRNAAS